MDRFTLRALVIDDDDASRGAFRTLLQQSGCDVMEAADGAQGLALAWERRPDMIIAQSLLPDLTGIDLVRKIRISQDGYRPYLMLATWPEDKAEILKTLDSGVDDIIDKPLSLAVVSAQLRAGQKIACLQQQNDRCMKKLQQYSQALVCSNLRLREMAMTDDLTGLPNRRYAMELLHREWALACKEDHPLACMVIDLDGLKQINDEQGRERGDVVLKTVAAIMRKYLPTVDMVCRTSGDEFLVIYPGASLPSVVACGEKLVGLISSFNIHAQDHALGLSIGVAERRAGVAGPEELITCAEQAMRCAKAAGGNQLCTSNGTELRLVRSDGKGTRKAKRQFLLWRQSEPVEAAAASL